MKAKSMANDEQVKTLSKKQIGLDESICQAVAKMINISKSKGINKEDQFKLSKGVDKSKNKTENAKDL